MGKRLDQWGQESPLRLPDRLQRSLASAYETTGALTIVDLDAKGAALYERITGKDTAAPTGLGIGLLVDLGQLESAFDADRLYRVARLVYERLDRHRDHLGTLLDDQGWRDDLLAARQALSDAQRKALVLVQADTEDRRMHIEAALEFGGKLTERVSRTVIGLVLAVDPAAKVVRDSRYTAIQAKARAAGLGELLLGLEPRVRNADAHVDYTTGDDHVVLGPTSPRPERLSDDELLDTVLAALESVGAILAGLDVVIAELGHSAAEDLFARLSLEERIAILLGATGLEPSRIEIKGDVLAVSAGAIAQAAPSPFSVMASVLPSLPAELRLMRLSVKGPRGTVRAAGRLDLLRRALGPEHPGKMAAHLHFGAKATANGRPIFTHDHVRKYVAVRMGALIDVPFDAGEAEMSALAALARGVGDAELVESVDAMVERRRQLAGRPPRSRASEAAINRLARYLHLDPGPANDGRNPQR